jgi:hypothetical protein
MSAMWRRQDGFIRGVVWLGLVVAVVALVVLDGMALFGVRRSAEESASAAAGEARNVYFQTQDMTSAQIAAQEYLTRSRMTLASFETEQSLDGSLVFKVTAKAHTDTYAFKFLGYVGLKGWVNRATDPVVTESAT